MVWSNILTPVHWYPKILMLAGVATVISALVPFTESEFDNESLFEWKFFI